MNILRVIFASIVLTALASLGLAQDTVVTKNSDGTYTVIQYPTDREITVDLTPSGTIPGKGFAQVVRSADGTHVHLDLNGVPTTVTSYYAYAVDPSGKPMLLGPLTFTNGVATADFTTPMDEFMLVLSPTEGLTGVTGSNVVFRSAVPAGFTVVPQRVVTTPMAAVGASTFARYQVPLLGISSFGKDAKTVDLHFKNGDLKGLDAKAHVHRHDDRTTVRVEFDDLKKVSPTKHFVLWAYAPDGTYTRLGQIYNWKNRDEAKIDTETSLTDFGLLMTVEDTDVTVPTSTIWSVFTVAP